MIDPNTLRILSIIAFVGLFLIGLKRPVYAVAAYMILVYCKLSSYYGLFAAMHSELVFAIIILLRLIITPDFFKNLSAKSNPTNKYLVFFVLCVMLSFSVAMDYQYSWDHAIYHLIKVLIFYFMVIAAVNSINDLKIFTILFLAMMAYLAYEPFYYFMTNTGGDEQIYGTNYIAQIGILSGHVALANNMNQVIPIVFFLLFTTHRKILKILYFIFFMIFLTALIGSGSRGGAIGFLFGLLVIFALSSKGNRKIVHIFLVASVVFIVLSASFISTLSRIQSDSATGRLLGLTHGIGMLTRGNILGVGPGCYPLARGQYFSYTMESHNIYGQLLGDLGVPGTIAWIFLIRQIIVNLSPLLGKSAKADTQSGFLIFLATGLFASLLVRLFISMASHGLYFFYWYLAAALSNKINYLFKQSSEQAIATSKIS